MLDVSLILLGHSSMHSRQHGNWPDPDAPAVFKKGHNPPGGCVVHT